MMKQKSINPKRSGVPLMVTEGLCDFCGSCVAVCPEDCIDLREKSISIDHFRCSLCMNCVKICPLHIIIYEEE